MRRLTLFILSLNLSLLAFSQLNDIQVRIVRNSDKSIDLYYDKSIPGSYFLSVQFPYYENCDAYPFSQVVKGKTGWLQKFRPIDTNKLINLSLKWSYILGVPNSKVDSSFVYLLPFSPGKKVLVKELDSLEKKYFGNKNSPKGKSYQFITQTPDTIFASRKGLVVKLEEDLESDTTKGISYKQKVNRIVVEHADGTYATYQGFAKEKILVKTGDIVYPQTALGLLGKYDNSADYQLRLFIYYLKEKKLDINEGKNLANIKPFYKYIYPIFLSDEGAVKLKKNTKYTAAVNDIVLTLELTKKELKKFRELRKEL